MDKNKFWLGGRLFNTASPRLGAPTQHKACLQVGRPNAMQGEFARWAPKPKTHPQRKHPHKGALGKKTSWRMDTNKFWLGGRLFNTASPRLGDAMQRKARPQDGCPRHVRKLGAPTQHKARRQVGRPNATQGTYASWVPQPTSATQTQGTSTRPQVGRPNATQGTSTSWAPQCTSATQT